MLKIFHLFQPAPLPPHGHHPSSSSSPLEALLLQHPFCVPSLQAPFLSFHPPTLTHFRFIFLCHIPILSLPSLALDCVAWPFKAQVNGAPTSVSSYHFHCGQGGQVKRSPDRNRDSPQSVHAWAQQICPSPRMTTSAALQRTTIRVALSPLQRISCRTILANLHNRPPKK